MNHSFRRFAWVLLMIVAAAGSISKPDAVMGALLLVQEGKLSLDENINTYLTSWKLPENEFTKAEKVTLRRIMSHSAGLKELAIEYYEKSLALNTNISNGARMVKCLKGE